MKIKNSIYKWVDIKAQSGPTPKPRGDIVGVPEPRSGPARAKYLDTYRNKLAGFINERV